MQKWEYLEESSIRGPLPTKEMNKLGAQGWELVNVVSIGSEIMYYFFKRPVQGAK